MAPDAETRITGRSYQDKVVIVQSSNGTSNSNNVSESWRPMDYLERRNRRNKCIAWSLFWFFTVIILGLACWRLEWMQMNRIHNKNPSSISTTTANEPEGLDTDDDLDDDDYSGDNSSGNGVGDITTGSSSNSMVSRARAALQRLNEQYNNTISRDINNNKHHAPVHAGCESTLMIIRHCEKDGDGATDERGNSHCSYEGYERTQYLTTLFGDTPEQRWPNPSKLYALTLLRQGHANYREWETLKPLSDRIGIPIDLTSRSLIADDYFALLNSGTLCGKVTLVCWKHSHIAELANSLGCSTENGCPASYNENEFDQVWQLKYVMDPPKIRYSGEDELLQMLKNNPNGTFTVPAMNSNTTIIVTNDTATQSATKDTHSGRRFRYLKKHHTVKTTEKERLPKYPEVGWSVYGSVTYQYFDPMEFSKQHGDYPMEGALEGGNWEYPSGENGDTGYNNNP